MAIFDGMHLTEKGALLINKLQSGANLTITRAGAGDGYYEGSESAWELEELKHPRRDCTCRIAAREVLTDGTTVLTLYIAAGSSVVPLREIGIYASDPDEGEILYASTNAGDYPDYLPPATTATTVARKYKVCIETGEAAEVTIEHLSVAEVTREEFENHTHPQLHSHDNKGVLDEITAERVHDWDTAAGGGAVVADGTITMAKLAPAVAAEVNKAHEHSNKTVLDSVTSTVVSNSHSHSNKGVLDGITGSEVSGWDAAAAHADNTDNPHGVTKSQVGLGNVPNVSTNNQTPTYTTASTLAEPLSGEKLSTAFGKIKLAVSRLIGHLANVSNPHGVTKAQVGLANVDNISMNDMFKSPIFTGTPKAPTPTSSSNNTQIATTAFVMAAINEIFNTTPQQIGTWLDGMPVWRAAFKAPITDTMKIDKACSVFYDLSFVKSAESVKLVIGGFACIDNGSVVDNNTTTLDGFGRFNWDSINPNAEYISGYIDFVTEAENIKS